MVPIHSLSKLSTRSQTAWVSKQTEHEADLMFSKSSNPGMFAAELAEKIRARNLVTLSGMGELPMSLALKVRKHKDQQANKIPL